MTATMTSVPGSRSALGGPGAWPDFGERRALLGAAILRRVRSWPFPAHELVGRGEVLARMSGYSWFVIFLGSGQRIEFPDGEAWRMPAIGVGGAICPIVVDADGRKVAVAAPGVGVYGINGRDYACVLAPAESRRFGRANRWVLRHHEDDLGIVTANPRRVETFVPVPIGAVLLSFVLVRFGIPGESAPRVPEFRWT